MSPRPNRIPGDLPFVVKADGRKFAFWFGGVAGGSLLLLCCLVGGHSYLLARDLNTPPTEMINTVAVPVLIPGMLVLGWPVLVAYRRLIGRGPLLAADHSGVWVRTAGMLGRPYWLPWEAVVAVYAGGNFGGKTVWIDCDPRHPAFPPGTRFPVRTLTSDHDARQILTALDGLASGRASVRPLG
ncbi:hypothetical protein I0C86_34800 [Plantactinospora sp. S1510]|uniref:PH domain-containing protein n=1 Tax=Plantactinospora alkalitolerans TaxID=2789879 RepID=A0ABS0H702_9ACTN|nr:hypothetical protein [Plantactinospora alkalitolerans]MBF9134071.1 hypothetical protein [Plantactinospora alkalitolerans]